MNRKQFVILLVVVAVLGAAGWMLHQRNQSSWQSGGQAAGRKLFGDLPINDVAQITIKNGTNMLTLAKKDGLWRVQERGDFPANYSDLSGFLIKAADLKAAQLEEVGPSQLGRFGLLPTGPGTNTATLVELKDQNGKTIQTLLVGKPHLRKSDRRGPMMDEGGTDQGWPDGRYIMVGSAAKQVALVSDPLDKLTTQAEQWLDKDFIKVEKLSSIAVTQAEPTNSWSLNRTNETADWVLAEPQLGEELDKNKLTGLGSFLAFASFNDVVEAGKPDADLGLDKPVRIALLTLAGFKYDLSVGHKEGSDDQFVRFTVGADLQKERTPGKDEKPEDKTKLDKDFADNLKKQEDKLKAEQTLGKWTYKVSRYTLEAGLKSRHELLAEKKPEPAGSTNPPSTNSPASVIPSIEIPGVPEAK